VSVLPREHRLVEAISEVSGTTGPDLDVSALLHDLAATSVDLLDADAASVHLTADAGDLETIATCGDDSRYTELFAEHTRDGPSAECCRRATVVSSVDLDLDLDRARWPAFAARARRLGFRSVYGIPLRSRDHVLGGLSLLRTRVGPLADSEIAVAQCLAGVATLRLVHHRAQRSAAAVQGQLESALTSRVIIEQAKGYLARDHGETPKEAFLRLRGFARRRRLPLTRVAEDVVARRLRLR
jgi:GAF domain-containing protein